MILEQEVIQACRKGDKRAQEHLYRQFYGFGMSVCLRYAPQREDAMEILNDSFYKVFKHISSYDAERPFKTWFRRILVNTALDHYRANSKYRLQVALDADEPDVPVEVFEPLDADQILEFFACLPELYRIIFNLYEVEGYNHEEIAGMLDIAPGTSRSHLSRAKKLLRSLYLNHQQKKQCHEAV